MSQSQDNSVLFALDGLRQQEALRAQQESEKRREQATIARKQADAAARGRALAKRNAEEVQRLRVQAETAAADRAALEHEIVCLRAAKRTPTPAPQAVSSPVASAGNPHHLLWAVTLLLSCLGVFVATYSPDTPPTSAGMSPPPVVTPEPTIVASNDCPARPMDTVKSSHSAAGIAEQKPTPATKTRKESRNTKKGARKRAGYRDQKIVLEECDGPLCYLPE